MKVVPNHGLKVTSVNVKKSRSYHPRQRTQEVELIGS